MDTVQNARRLLLRGQQAARAQWRFHCAVHNLLKLHRAGGLEPIKAQSGPPANSSARKHRAAAALGASIHRLIARFRRPHSTIRARSVARIAPSLVTDPGS